MTDVAISKPVAQKGACYLGHSKKGLEKAKRTGKIWFRLYLMLTIVVILFVSVLNGSVL